ncbi:MAG: sigma-54-dependent Fis family transcriptional regulator [Desulfobacteraceae bacterium]|nr:MAG: sigma-54-dependent Fis family transcriptional regulator [Desulfobacteraceae bacterium]
MANILIIDDDLMFSRMMADLMIRMEHKTYSASTLKGGMEKMGEAEMDLVLLDVRLPDGSGLDILPRIRSVRSSPEVIILTGFGDQNGAELAIKNGAWDYLEKTSSISMLTLPVMRALQYREARRLIRIPKVLKRDGIIGSSPQIESCIDSVAGAAAGDGSVLIVGDSGTGKELFARAIHENSIRSGKNFVVVDCGALPSTLVESILFGHEKGTFTGADRAREGLIKQAHGGTLFLDEVGELPPGIQKTFLRVLQEHRFRPIGSTHEVESDFRLVAATNRNLEQMGREGLFREDLLFRLRSSTLLLPPLKNRTEDITDLTMYHLRRLSERYGLPFKGVSPEFLEILQHYEWPGNVRELFHATEAAFAKAGDEPTLFPMHLPPDLRVKVRLAISATKKRPPGPVPAHSVLPSLHEARKGAVTKAEKEYIIELLSRAGGDVESASQIAGVSRAQIYRLMQKHEIRRSVFRLACE